LPEFEGKVNCIYIDPPYNTGNKKDNFWVYSDNVDDPRIKQWIGKIVGSVGEDLSRHDKWLCMMYPRLKLLHRLLADDGVIFISIDDNEQANLKLICDEIFGDNNFITNFIWQKKNGGGNDSKYVAIEHEYILVYIKRKNESDNWFLPYDDEYFKRYNEIDEQGAYYWDTFMRASGKQYYPIKCPDGSLLQYDENGHPLSWLRSEERFLSDYAEGKIRIIQINGSWTVHFKQYASEGKKPRSILQKIANNSDAKQVVFDIFQKQNIFPYSKPYQVVEYLLKIVTNPNSIVLDSFAGSGTTAHAVLKLNAEDGGNRRFILCEMMDYAESITAERVRRVMEGYGEGNKKVEGLGGSFDFYELGDALFSESGLLNESVGIERIRQYIAYSESISLDNQLPIENSISPSALGINQQTLWLFHYNKDAITSLDLDFLGTLNLQNVSRPSQFVVYADKCVLDDKFMQKHGITFKRIPRDIMRF
jgi:adenine-specific DNA-methyltransferase